MMTGVISVLLAESLMIGSWGIAGRGAVFVTANLIYIPNWEEPALINRFGDDYRRFKANVPRWIPACLRRSDASASRRQAVRPWEGPWEGGGRREVSKPLNQWERTDDG